jgi:hypothetical protein
LGGYQRSFCLGQRGQLLLPALLKAARDQTVLGITEMKRAFGSRGIIASTLQLEFQCSRVPCPSVRDFLGCRKRHNDLVRGHCREKALRYYRIDELGYDAATGRSLRMVGT